MKIMRLVLVAAGVFAAVGTAGAADEEGGGGKSIAGAMMRLSLDERAEQACNARALGTVGREHKDFHPDEMAAYAFAETAIVKGKVTAPGAAFRSKGVWYRLSYVCQTADEGMAIQSFSYKLGAPVPRAEWDKHNLTPP